VPGSTESVGWVKRSVTRHVRAFYDGGLRFAPPALLLLSLLTGCAVPAETVPPSACLLPNQKPMLVAELFFGRNVPGRAPVSEAEWADFVARVVAPNFPDGFTVFNGDYGQGRDPRLGAVEREPPKIVLAAAEPRPDLKDRVETIRNAYQTRFAQRSVGVLTRWECGAF
jgi:uncharacterized protein DUF3574